MKSAVEKQAERDDLRDMDEMLHWEAKREAHLYAAVRCDERLQAKRREVAQRNRIRV